MKFEKYTRESLSVTIPIPESFSDCILLAKSDQFRLSGRVKSTFRLFFDALKLPFNPQSYLVWFRLASVKGFWRLPFIALHHWSGSFCKIDIPRTTKIGFGFYIGHGMCMVISEDTIIGNNVNVSQFLNIGTNCCTPALIGDNVYLCPAVCVVEDVTIGENAVIGAGAVVSRSIPANATAVGVPAKVVNYNTKNYINNKFNLPW